MAITDRAWDDDPDCKQRTPEDVLTKRIVVTVNARVTDNELHGGTDSSMQRRTDFGELITALDASVVDWTTLDQTRTGRFLRRRVGFGPTAALFAFAAKKRYDIIWCFSEVEGLLLALLFKLFRVHKELYFIAVEPVSPKATVFLRRLRVWTHFTAILPTNSHQADAIIRDAGVPATKVTVLPYQVDCRYFRRESSNAGSQSDRPLVVAVGLESRDYTTLVKAVAGLNVDVFVAAASLWSGDRATLPDAVPPNVTVGKCSYTELRELYARSALAVIPLLDSPYQHGITAIQEAMSMGLPVIVTRTKGQGDVVIDRRRVLRANPALSTKGNFAQMFRPDRLDLQESNGFYVGPGDEQELRKCICYLLEHRDVAATLGANAQRFARELLSVELFVERSVALIRQTTASTSPR